MCVCIFCTAAAAHMRPTLVTTRAALATPVPHARLARTRASIPAAPQMFPRAERPAHTRCGLLGPFRWRKRRELGCFIRRRLIRVWKIKKNTHTHTKRRNAVRTRHTETRYWHIYSSALRKTQRVERGKGTRLTVYLARLGDK